MYTGASCEPRQKEILRRERDRARCVRTRIDDPTRDSATLVEGREPLQLVKALDWNEVVEVAAMRQARGCRGEVDNHDSGVKVVSLELPLGHRRVVGGR